LSSACAAVNTLWAGDPPTNMYGQAHQTNENPIQGVSEVWYGLGTNPSESCQHINDGYYVFNVGSPGVSSTYVIVQTIGGFVAGIYNC
jgi:hypothetical protein